MSSRHIPTISFGAALLTNLNIMIGVGIFVNTAPLIKEAGALSPLSYLIVGRQNVSSALGFPLDFLLLIEYAIFS